MFSGDSLETTLKQDIVRKDGAPAPRTVIGFQRGVQGVKKVHGVDMFDGRHLARGDGYFNS